MFLVNLFKPQLIKLKLVLVNFIVMAATYTHSATQM